MFELNDSSVHADCFVVDSTDNNLNTQVMYLLCCTEEIRLPFIFNCFNDCADHILESSRLKFDT